MSDETVNIRIPDPLDLTQYRIQVGDTVQFIEKMTGTQDDLDTFSDQLNLTVSDMQSAADQIAARHTQILQTGQQVADDKNTVEQLRTETGQDRQAAEQAASTATTKAGIATDAAGSASESASVASAAEESSSENAYIASQAQIAATQQRQLAEEAAQQAAQSAIEAGPTNLSFTRTATTLTVKSSTGDDVVLPAATTGQAGLMSATDKAKLEDNVVAMTNNTVNCSLGNYFTRSISANTTFAFTNAPSPGAYAFSLRVIVIGTRTITWPNTVRWPGNTAPTLTASRQHLFMFVTDDGGATWRGAALVDYTG